MNAAELPYGMPDPMMQELRDIRIEIQDILEPLSPEERLAWFHEQARESLQSCGYELVANPNRPRAYQIRKK